MFGYYHCEFLEAAWPGAMKQYANLIELNRYSTDSDELFGCYKRALVTWEDKRLIDIDDEALEKLDLRKAGAEVLRDIPVMSWEQQVIAWLRAVDRHPTDVILHQTLANLYEANDDHKAAILGWKQLMNTHPNNVHFQARLGGVYSRLKDPSEAIQKLHRLLEKYPENETIQQFLVKVYTKAGDKQASIDGWTRLIISHPSAAGLPDRLAEVYSSNGDHPDAALEHFIRMKGQRGVQLSKLEQCLAKAYSKEGAYDRAIIVWWKVLEENMFDINAWIRFRDTYDLKRLSLLGVTSTTSMGRFAWLCFFANLSRKFIKLHIGEVDWWPLAKKDELMILRPFMDRYQWRCVCLPINGCDQS